MALMRVRLELAKMTGFPEGSSVHGYEFVAPLDSDGHLKVVEWRRVHDRCAVMRFWQGSDDANGRLTYTSSRDWAFSFSPDGNDEQPAFRLERHLFRVGEYVSITEQDGVTRPFKVVLVEPVQS